MTITYDDQRTSSEALAAIIKALDYGVEEVQAQASAVENGFASFPAPLPENAPDDFTHAFQTARAAGRPILIDFWAPWCAPCVRLKRQTLEDPKVAAQLEKVEVIFVNLDEHPNLAQSYDVSSIPDVFFVNAQGVVVDRLLDFETAAPFLERLERLASPETKAAGH